MKGKSDKTKKNKTAVAENGAWRAENKLVQGI